MHEYQCVTSALIMRAVKAGCIYVHCSGVCQTAQPESGDTGDDNSGCGVPTRSYRAGMGYGSPPDNPSGRGSGSVETSSPGGVFTRFASPAGTSSCAGACGLFPHVLANSDALMRKRIFSHVAHCLSGQDSTCSWEWHASGLAAGLRGREVTGIVVVARMLQLQTCP
jgi:hypothetical protein